MDFRRLTRSAARVANKMVERMATTAAMYGAKRVGQAVVNTAIGAVTKRPRSTAFARTKRRRYIGKTGAQRARKKKLVRTIKTVARRVQQESKSLGVYKKILPEWRYHLASPGPGGSAENVQGVSETYFCQPYEILDAASVLFNSKAKAADYTLTTNNFSGDPDISLAGASCHVTLHSTSQLPFGVDVYKVTCKQDASVGGLARWQMALDEQAGAGTVYHYNMGITPYDGSQEMKRYWKVEKVKSFVLQPGKAEYVGSLRVGRRTLQWEDMKANGSVLSYKGGLTSGYVFVQHMPIQYNSTGNKIGVPSGGWGGFTIEKKITFKVLCPDNAIEAENVDKLMYLNNYGTTLGTTVYPSKPEVSNIAVQNQ